MIFGTLAICAAALASVAEASRHQHYGRNHGVHARLHANETNVTSPILAPTAISPSPLPTNSSAPVAPYPTTYLNQTTALNRTGSSVPPASGSPSIDFTTTLVQTNTKLTVITITLGDGKEVVTTVTKCERTTKTEGHVKSTLTVSPIIEAVASSRPSVPPSPSPSSPTPLEKPRSTSTFTTVVYVTLSTNGTLTVVPRPTCSPIVSTVFVPSLTTVYSTVTVSVTPSPLLQGSARDPTASSTGKITGTTTTTVYKTVTMPIYSNTTITHGGYSNTTSTRGFHSNTTTSTREFQFNITTSTRL